MFAPRRTLHSTPLFCVDELLVQLADAGVNTGTGADTLFLDIGCGDGRVLSAVAEKFGCECRGWEIDKARAQGAKNHVHEAGLDNLVSVFDCNFLDDQALLLAEARGEDEPKNKISTARQTGTKKKKRIVAFCYLTQRGLRRLAPTLQTLNAFVVTFLYSIPDERPSRRLPVADPINENRVFLMYTYDYGALQVKKSNTIKSINTRIANDNNTKDVVHNTALLVQSRKRLIGTGAMYVVTALLLSAVIGGDI